MQRLQFPRLRQTKLCLLLKVRTWKMQSSCSQGSGFLDKDWLRQLCLKITLKAYSVLKCKCVYCTVENTIFFPWKIMCNSRIHFTANSLCCFFKSNNKRLLRVAKESKFILCSLFFSPLSRMSVLTKTIMGNSSLWCHKGTVSGDSLNPPRDPLLCSSSSRRCKKNSSLSRQLKSRSFLCAWSCKQKAKYAVSLGPIVFIFFVSEGCGYPRLLCWDARGEK